MIKNKQRKIHTDDETWERLRILSKASGRSISSYVRSLANFKQPMPLPPEEYRKIYAELSAIGNNINQMAKLSHINGSADYESFEADLKVIYEIRRQLAELTTKERSIE